MANTFNDFRLSKYLTDVQIVKENNEHGETIEYEIFKVTENVSVYLYESGLAELKVGDIKAIKFNYNKGVAEVFANINYIPAPMMFEVLVKNQIK